MIKIRILGSASGIPTRKRFNTSIVVGVKKDVYLFDCGEPASALLLRSELDYSDIEAVFISHMHSDHAGGVFQLIQSMQLSGRKRELKLFVPGEAINALKGFLNTVYLIHEEIPFRLQFLSIEPGGYVYQNGSVHVSACATNHLRCFTSLVKKHGLSNLMQSYGFLLEAEGKKILYSGDISAIEELEPVFREQIDLLILELAHVQPDIVFDYLQGKDVEHIVLTHLHPDLGDQTQEIIKKCPLHLRQKLDIGYDGWRLDIQ